MRNRLANRRRCDTFELNCRGLRYICSVGYFPDGDIAEIFLSNHKAASAADVAARDAAIAASLALQHGATIESIRAALCREQDGSASGPLGMALDILRED